ncbi:hypothetical protein HMPREF0758_3515 [Serratia odorifera DSM 4582]|uniref:Uncharacterized protein n=1 Tax=Serratia odorifera DSM 4582 TaxID=667129 RepID=D4E5R5_SEROD|nr:hypothetical protein HMPREF0758_3515 [Serratia odorifera DSM 4582]
MIFIDTLPPCRFCGYLYQYTPIVYNVCMLIYVINPTDFSRTNHIKHNYIFAMKAF